MTDKLDPQRVTEAAQFHAVFLVEAPFTFGALEPDVLRGMACAATEMINTEVAIASFRTASDADAAGAMRIMLAALWAHGFKTGATACASTSDN